MPMKSWNSLNSATGAMVSGLPEHGVICCRTSLLLISRLSRDVSAGLREKYPAIQMYFTCLMSVTLPECCRDQLSEGLRYRGRTENCAFIRAATCRRILLRHDSWLSSTSAGRRDMNSSLTAGDLLFLHVPAMSPIILLLLVDLGVSTNGNCVRVT